MSVRLTKDQHERLVALRQTDDIPTVERIRQAIDDMLDAATAAALICDCGAPKLSGAEGCRACLILDGRRDADRDVIGMLRTLGGTATAQALEERLGLGHRFVLRVLARISDEGRVTRRLGEDDDPTDFRGWRNVRWVLVERGSP